MKSNWFQRYLLPGFVFQSVIIAGGYGTGRELVEFARVFRVFDYNDERRAAPDEAGG